MSAAKTAVFSSGEGATFLNVVRQVAESKISPADLAALEQLLGLKLDGEFYLLRKSLCTNCGKELSFYDLVKTAIDNGVHDQKFFTDLLTSKTFTVRVGNQATDVTCTNCATPQQIHTAYDCTQYCIFA